MRHFITFDVNNQGVLTMYQDEHDGKISVISTNHPDESYTISAGDMVMLLNLYQYVKRYNIQNDFINPNGRRPEP